MHIPYIVRFNNNFDCEIYSLGELISYKTLSRGQKKKIDFIIIISFIKLLKTKYPSLNILFLDELFSSIDGEGIYEIIKILRSVVKDNSLHTLIINHSELPIEFFDKKFLVEFDGGFSKLLIEDIV
jgi:DNA repair exonuclease SbcCD ATPase subunit